MSSETSQFDISVPLTVSGGDGPGRCTDIGEAKVVKTVFGKAKIRVTYKQHKRRRWWLTVAWVVMALFVAGVATVIWLEENALLHPEQIQVVTIPVVLPNIGPKNSQAVQTELVDNGGAAMPPEQKEPQIPVGPQPPAVTVKPASSQMKNEPVNESVKTVTTVTR